MGSHGESPHKILTAEDRAAIIRVSLGRQQETGLRMATARDKGDHTETIGQEL